ncbi:hypothetical protein V8C26DRAFT_391217 [Trichoderma gracile]
MTEHHQILVLFPTVVFRFLTRLLGQWMAMQLLVGSFLQRKHPESTCIASHAGDVPWELAPVRYRLIRLGR